MIPFLFTSQFDNVKKNRIQQTKATPEMILWQHVMMDQQVKDLP